MIYLNHAATTYPKPQQVLEAVDIHQRYEILCEHLLNEIEIAKAMEELA